MKELFSRLLNSLGIGGRDWVVLILALLLAFCTWLIHNLSLKYNDFLTVTIIAQSTIEGHSDISSNQCEVIARCRATGYNVLRYKEIDAEKERVVTFLPEVVKHQKDDIFYVTAADIHEYSHLIYGADVTVDYFVTDTLFFTFPKVDFKKLPVYPIYSVSFKDQYTDVAELKVQPDSVTAYGDPDVLANIDKIYTEPIKRSDVSADIKGITGLENVNGIRLSVDEVAYSMDVTRYVEIICDVKVDTRNVPSDKEMVLLPSKVKATLKCFFPLVGDPAFSFKLFVDYNEMVKTVSGKCPVRYDSLPEGVIEYSIDPFYVECLVRDK